ncbi:MAG: ABC transporter permease [Mycobacteriales bacterium]
MTTAGAVTGEPGTATRRSRFSVSGVLQTWGPSLALLVLVLVFSAKSEQFRTLSNFKGVLDQASVLLILSCGLTFVIVMGAIDLSLEGVMGACSIAVALLVANNQNGNRLGLGGSALALLLGVAFGVLNGLVNTRLRIPSFIATLGTGAIGIGVATVMFAGKPPHVKDDYFRSIALKRFATQPFEGLSRVTVLALIVLLVTFFIQRFTRLGRYAYVIGGGEDIARLSGINVDRYKVGVFALSGACAGLSGIVVSARIGQGDVLAGRDQLFAAVTAVVVGGTLLQGGRGGVLHSAVGVLIVSVLENGMILLDVEPYYQKAVRGLLIVLAVTITTWPLRGKLRVVK